MTREPKFEEVPNIHIASENINKPHEDYPQRVRGTEEVIKWGIKHNIKSVDEILLHSISNHLGFEGRYRDVEVQVGEYYPFPPFYVPMQMIACYTDNIKTRKEFETIHPY